MVVLRRIYDTIYVYVGYVNFLLFVSSIAFAVVYGDINPVTYMGVTTAVLMGSIMLWLPSPKSKQSKLPSTKSPITRVVESSNDNCACTCDCECHDTA